MMKCCLCIYSIFILSFSFALYLASIWDIGLIMVHKRYALSATTNFLISGMTGLVLRYIQLSFIFKLKEIRQFYYEITDVLHSSLEAVEQLEKTCDQIALWTFIFGIAFSLTLMPLFSAWYNYLGALIPILNGVFIISFMIFMTQSISITIRWIEKLSFNLGIRKKFFENVEMVHVIKTRRLLIKLYDMFRVEMIIALLLNVVSLTFHLFLVCLGHFNFFPYFIVQVWFTIAMIFPFENITRTVSEDLF